MVGLKCKRKWRETGGWGGWWYAKLPDDYPGASLGTSAQAPSHRLFALLWSNFDLGPTVTPSTQRVPPQRVRFASRPVQSATLLGKVARALDARRAGC